jgi:hypothetical protein
LVAGCNPGEGQKTKGGALPLPFARFFSGAVIIAVTGAALLSPGPFTGIPAADDMLYGVAVIADVRGPCRLSMPIIGVRTMLAGLLIARRVVF